MKKSIFFSTIIEVRSITQFKYSLSMHFLVKIDIMVFGMDHIGVKTVKLGVHVVLWKLI